MPRRGKTWSLSDEIVEAIKQDWRKTKNQMTNDEADSYPEGHHVENLLKLALETPLEQRRKRMKPIK